MRIGSCCFGMICIFVGEQKSGYIEPLNGVSFDSFGVKQLTRLMPIIMAEFRVRVHKKFGYICIIL